MLKRELKVNFKSFLIWTLVTLVIFLIVFLIYPSIVSSNNLESIDEMMKIFPEEVLKAFNMDIASMSSAFGWLKTEGFIFILLIIAAYSGILGSNILLKEENDKTIEYLNSVPVSRNKILFSKIIVGVIYIFLMTLIIGVFNFICLDLSGDFDKKAYILLSTTPLLSSIVTFSLCLFISTFTHKTKKTIGISLGIVFASYIFNIISEMADSTEFLKYFSTFTLADIRNVLIDVKINPIMILLSIILTATLFILTTIRFNKKELL